VKLKACDRGAAIACLSANWFSPICLAAFLTALSASAAVPQTAAERLNPAEKWVVAQVTAGNIARPKRAIP